MNKFVDMRKAYIERWVNTDHPADDEGDQFVTAEHIKNFYDQFREWSFDQIVEEWKMMLTQDLGKAFAPAFEGDAPADTPQGRAEEIFSQFETDKIILISQSAQCREKNAIFANTLMRRAIALAVHQHAVMVALLGLGIMPSKNMAQHELLKSYWYGFNGLFGGFLYIGGKDKPATELTDKTLMKLELHTAEERMKAVIEDGVAKGVLKPVKLSDSGRLSKQFKGCDWADVHLQVQFKQSIKFGQGKDWFIKVKPKGGRWKTYSVNDLGFAPQSEKPRVLFETLKHFAANNGFYNPRDVHGKVPQHIFQKKREALRGQVKRLRAHLKKLFPIDGDPIPPYNKRDGSWHIKFAECKLTHRDVIKRSTKVQLDPEGKTIPTSSSDALDYLADDDDDVILRNVDQSGEHYDPNTLFDDPNELTDN